MRRMVLLAVGLLVLGPTALLGSAPTASAGEVVGIATGFSYAKGVGVLGTDYVIVSDQGSDEIVLLDHNQDRQPYGDFPDPGAVAVARDGTFYVAYGDGRIAEFVDHGWYGAFYTPNRNFASGFSSIGDIDVTAKGVLYVSEPDTGTVWRQREWSRTPVATGLGRPTGLAVASDGTLYVGDRLHQRIWQISPDGTRRPFGPRGVMDPVGMSWSAKEGLLVASGLSGTIIAVTASGSAYELLGGNEDSGDVVGYGGQVYFSVPGDVAVQRTPYSLSGATLLRSSPNEPVNIRPGYTTRDSGQVRWDPPPGNGLTVTGYVISVSRDGGASWRSFSVGGSVRQADVPALDGPAQAALVRVAAVNAMGMGPASAPAIVTTGGARLMRVAVVDADGEPVIGGAITWEMTDLPTRSSLTYGLTDAGLIDFPLAPAGRVAITVKDARTAAGATVSGTFEAVLGYDLTVLTLPSAPVTTNVVRVTIPIENGLVPVPGAAITVDDAAGQFTDDDCRDWAFGTLDGDDLCLDYSPASIKRPISFTTTVDGFRFDIPEPEWPLKTDGRGYATIAAFMNGSPRIQARYDDGIVDQGINLTLRSEVTRADLEYLPWLEVSTPRVTADVGDPVAMRVQVQAPFAETLTRGRLLAMSSVRGIPVRVIRPRGAPLGRCASRLSARTDSRGRATLIVCATKSGEYSFAPAGAAAVSSIMLRVRGTAPLPPTTVDARSSSAGTLSVTWNPPTFDGDAEVTGYTVTAERRWGRMVTRKVPATQRLVTLRGLTHATDYTVTVAATTRYGTSDRVSVTVPVA